jgi:hypothetical protein
MAPNEILDMLFSPLIHFPVTSEQHLEGLKLYRESWIIFNVDSDERRLFLGQMKNKLVLSDSEFKNIHLSLYNFLHFFLKVRRVENTKSKTSFWGITENANQRSQPLRNVITGAT